MVCTFYIPAVKQCQNAYCYYETNSEHSCPVKIDYMNKIGPVDPALKVRLREEERKEIEKERAKAVIWGKK